MNIVKNNIFMILLLVVVVVGVFSPFRNTETIENNDSTKAGIETRKVKEKNNFCKKIEVAENFVDSTGHYTDIPILAKSAVVYDATNDRVLFGKDLHTPRPLASLTKVLTATTALSVIDGESLISIPEYALGDHFDNFTIGEKWRVKDLASYALITSSNDAARALGIGTATFFEKEYLHESFPKNGDTVAMFIDAMREKARQYYMDETVDYGIKSMSGLDTKEGLPSVVGTMLEASQLMLCAFTEYPGVLITTKTSESAFVSGDNKTYEAVNTNSIISQIPSLVFSKTGYTLQAGGNLMIGFTTENKHLILVGVLGSTKEARFTDVLLLTQATQNLLQKLEL
jgi:D-alanyl-D-alanine carboxypeptidase